MVRLSYNMTPLFLKHPSVCASFTLSPMAATIAVAAVGLYHFRLISRIGSLCSYDSCPETVLCAEFAHPTTYCTGSVVTRDGRKEFCNFNFVDGLLPDQMQSKITQ